MRTPRIHTDTALSAGETVALDDSAAHHVGRVLRMQPGQPLVLFNGDGQDYPATLREVGKKNVIAELDTPVPGLPESPLHIILGQTLSKGDRMDFAVQKSVELGVAAIVPLVTERCDVRLKGDREDKRLRHWQSVAVSAAEQCGRAVVPSILPVMDLDRWFDYTADCDARLVLHHRTQQALASLAPPSTLALMVGPEGGLSDTEISRAGSAGFMPAALGPRVLRTETAPLAAIAVCQWLWGDTRG